jgi:hypothetical protein
VRSVGQLSVHAVSEPVRGHIVSEVGVRRGSNLKPSRNNLVRGQVTEHHSLVTSCDTSHCRVLENRVTKQTVLTRNNRVVNVTTIIVLQTANEASRCSVGHEADTGQTASRTIERVSQLNEFVGGNRVGGSSGNTRTGGSNNTLGLGGTSTNR